MRRNFYIVVGTLAMAWLISTMAWSIGNVIMAMPTSIRVPSPHATEAPRLLEQGFDIQQLQAVQTLLADRIAELERRVAVIERKGVKP